jgi:hypothetical protein
MNNGQVELIKGALVFNDAIITPLEWKTLIITLMQEYFQYEADIAETADEHSRILIPDSVQGQTLTISEYIEKATRLADAHAEERLLKQRIESLQEAKIKIKQQIIGMLPELDVEFAVGDYRVRGDSDDEFIKLHITIMSLQEIPF